MNFDKTLHYLLKSSNRLNVKNSIKSRNSNNENLKMSLFCRNSMLHTSSSRWPIPLDQVSSHWKDQRTLDLLGSRGSSLQTRLAIVSRTLDT